MNLSWFCIFHAKVRNKMRIIISPIFFLFQICYAAPDTPEIIDVHMHFQALPNLDIHGSEMSALQTMDRFNVQRSLLMPPPYTKTNQQNFYDIEDLRLVVRDHPDRFALLGGSTLNAMLHNTPAGNVDDPIRRRFINRAKEILALGAPEEIDELTFGLMLNALPGGKQTGDSSKTSKATLRLVQ